MPRLLKRNRRTHSKSPTFSFATRRLRGVPEETKEQREQMERAKAEWLAKHKPTRK